MFDLELFERLKKVVTGEDLNEMSSEQAASYFKTLIKHCLYYFEVTARGGDTCNVGDDINNFVNLITKHTNDIKGKAVNKIIKVEGLFSSFSDDGVDKFNLQYSNYYPLRSLYAASLIKKLSGGTATLKDLGMKWEYLPREGVKLVFAPADTIG
jgi:hypothetical protein